MRLRRPSVELIVLFPVLAAALAVAAVAFGSIGGDIALPPPGDTRLRPVDVQRFMLTTPNPYDQQHVRDAVSADCHGGLQPDLTERWRCAMRYRSGTADLHIIVQADGSFFAQVVGGAGAITGCCLKRGG